MLNCAKIKASQNIKIEIKTWALYLTVQRLKSANLMRNKFSALLEEEKLEGNR